MKAALPTLALILGGVALLPCAARADDAAPATCAPEALTQAEVAALLSKSLDKNSSLSVDDLKSLLKMLLQSDPELVKFLCAHPEIITKVLPPAPAGATSSTAAQSSGDNTNASYAAREELAQARAMADAALASCAASTASTAPASPGASSSVSATSHYTTASLVDSSRSLRPDPSDTTHHSMSELIDNP